MGHVIKHIGKVYIRIDNYAILSDSERKRIPANMIRRREGYDLIVYPESNGEFDYFYAKHINRDRKIGNGINSVLVVDGEYKLNELQTRLLLEKTLKRINIHPKLNIIPSKIFQILEGHTLSVRDYNFDNETFTSDSKDCCFIFRDILDITAKNMLIAKQKYLSKKELAFVLNYANKWKDLDEIYAVRRVIFVGKYYVATST